MRLFVGLLVSIMFSANGPAMAQTFSPSYDCGAVIDAVEVFICQDRSLAALDRDLSNSYRVYISTLPISDAEQLRNGQIAWIKDRNTRCKITDRLIDRSCIESAYKGRKVALDSLASLSIVSGAWERDGMYWVQLASRSSADEAIMIARSMRQKAPQYQPYIVLLAANGWYAVVSGPYQTSYASSVLESIKISDPVIAAEGPYASRGRGYVLRLYHSQEELPQIVEKPTRTLAYTQPTPPAYSRPSPTRQRCSSEEIFKRQAVCFVALIGEAACQDMLAKESQAGVILTGAATAAMCSAASSGLQNGTIDAKALLGPAFRGALASAGTAMARDKDNDMLTRAFGAFLTLGVAGYEVSQAFDCARDVERNCAP
jgi:uncharacterized protein